MAAARKPLTGPRQAQLAAKLNSGGVNAPQQLIDAALDATVLTENVLLRAALGMPVPDHLADLLSDFLDANP